MVGFHLLCVKERERDTHRDSVSMKVIPIRPEFDLRKDVTDGRKEGFNMFEGSPAGGRSASLHAPL